MFCLISSVKKMVKISKMKKTLKTYGKKKTTHKKGHRSIVVNVNYFQITNQFIVSKSSSDDDFGKQSMYHPSTSKSGDEFDQLLKGPIYNKSSTSR